VGFSPDQRFLYIGGTPVIYILNRKTLEVLGTVYTGVGTPGHPPGHGSRTRSPPRAEITPHRTTPLWTCPHF